jgi:hypothetical protein
MKKEAGLSDEAYRDLLFKAAGVRSAADLVSHDQFNRVVTAMQSLGAPFDPTKIKFKAKQKAENLFKYSFSKPNVPWKFKAVTDEAWANMGNIISDNYDIGISVVAVQEANGQKYFKYRPMR